MDELINDRYRVTRFLGEGGFGTVYLAEDLKAPRNVVLKVSRDPRSEYEALAFKREIDALTRVDHPNVIKLFDVGVTDAGTAYLVQEYVDGPSLGRILSFGPLAITDALVVLIAVSRGLEALHRDGLIHRDIKPTNVLIPTENDRMSFAKAKLADLGVAGKLDAGSGRTIIGQFFGTPLYMSPEQLRADSQSPLSDIYAVGVVLYEMVYGRTPYSGIGFYEVYTAKVEGRVTLPADTDVPQELTSLIIRCLRPDPADRPQSASELAQQAQSILAHLEENRRSVQMGGASRRKTIFAERRISTEITLARPRTGLRLMQISAVLLIAGFATGVWIKWGVSQQLVGISVGVVYVICGVMLGQSVRGLLTNRHGGVHDKLGQLLSGGKSRASLTTSFAIEIDKLIATVRKVDDRVLAASLAIMVKEYEESRDSQHRQAAVMNAVQIVEKLKLRLSPWYVTHEKLVTTLVALVGVLSGATAIATAIVNLVKGK
ncbi:MAG TPA: serine/threonine-protein kinase [Blastocatellia bacterium]|nr:serine/threonine-protein kinase [Blastocatellia bacterium]